MDIFKLLSRSTKASTKTGKRDLSSHKLPSSGVSGDPQLYHDVLPDSPGKKRKRGPEKPVEKITLENEAEINYFAPRARSTEPPEKKTKYPIPEAHQLLSEDECRKILRSHRIKVTLLNFEKKQRDHKTKKNSKKSSETIAKEEPQQIFPQPLTAFSQLQYTYGISNRLAENLGKQGYRVPTEVQMASLPLLLRPEIALGGDEDKLKESGVNILAIAPTGSGKTLAFLIPIVNKIIQRRRQCDDAREHVMDAVVIAPTKELADQILSEAKKLCVNTGVKVCGMRKGMRIVETDDGDGDCDGDEGRESVSSEDEASNETPKKKSITKPDILVTTPGLFLSALATKKSKCFATLPTVRTLVLDEADVLLDALFRDQILSIWSTLNSPDLSVSLWSATISSSIESLACSTICTQPNSIRRPLIRLVIGLKDSALPTISHNLTYCATEPGKLMALRNLIHASSSSDSSNPVQVLRPPAIIFTQTIPRATALYTELLYDIPPIAGGSSRIAVLHSSLSTIARAAILERFRQGEIWILVTTDLLARGVDFRGVNAVVNYDIPNDSAGYIHRVGRTGRAGRIGGVAITLYTREDIPFIRGVVNIIEASRKAAGDSSGESSGKDYKWLLQLLPKTSKEDKKKLKARGVEARRNVIVDTDTKDASVKNTKNSTRKKPNMRIGTTSGYELKLKNRKIGAIKGSQRRAINSASSDAKVNEDFDHEADESEWSGIDE
ncbi:ATP-dependent RNA helicase [Podosphaera aphanis]|nr:ATP-dependent RNA helicase [Podosphaera aphanis]